MGSDSDPITVCLILGFMSKKHHYLQVVYKIAKEFIW